MKQVPDRKKLRQEYLQLRRTAIRRFFWGIFGSIIVTGNLVVTLDRHHVRPGSTMFVSGLVAYMIFLLSGLWEIKMAHHKAKMAYAPPITPDILPAEEILVRGSEEPPIVHSEVLLRAAKGIETPKEELLRVNQE